MLACFLGSVHGRIGRRDEPAAIFAMFGIARQTNADAHPHLGKLLQQRRIKRLDQTPRDVTLVLEDFQLGEIPTPRKPTPALIQSVLFVVDTWHTKPGSSGTVWVSGVSLGRTSAPVTSGR